MTNNPILYQSDDVLPWSLKLDKPIGVQRAREIVAWVKPRIAPAIGVGCLAIWEIEPGVPIVRSSKTVEELARVKLSVYDKRLTIGTLRGVTESGPGVTALIGIDIHCHLVVVPGLRLWTGKPERMP